MDPCVCDFTENDCALIRYRNNETEKILEKYSCLAENYFTYIFCYFAMIITAPLTPLLDMSVNVILKEV